MRLKDIYNQQKLVISFEIFPPKKKEAEAPLFDELKILSEYNPSFISVTYGAGGSTRNLTFDLVLRIKNELGVQPMPHFTCVGSTRDDILNYIQRFEQNGIRNILALRGDPPKGEEKFVKPECGFGYANELVEFIKSQTDLSIGVAGYPECHQECCSIEVDIDNLKRKVDAGAEAIITQLFYDNECYYDFVEKSYAKGVNIPIIPGILPITSYKQIEKIVAMSDCKLPADFKVKLEQNKENLDAMREIGLEFAVNQCNELIAKGVAGIHFYTLNKSGAVKAVIDECTGI